MKLQKFTKALTLSIVSTVFISGTLAFSNAFASNDVYSEESYVNSLIASIENGSKYTEEQYVASIINAIENPAAYSERDYVNALVESTSDFNTSNVSSYQFKQLRGGTFYTAYSR